MKFLECNTVEEIRAVYMEATFKRTSKADRLKASKQRKKDKKKNPALHKKKLKKQKKRAKKVKSGAIKVDPKKAMLAKKIAKTRGK